VEERVSSEQESARPEPSGFGVARSSGYAGHPILRLQQLIGNQAVTRLVQRETISGNPRDLTNPAGQQTSGMAIATLVLGIFLMWGLGSLLALVFELLARREIKRSQGHQTGLGLATAGITLGSIGLAGAGALLIFTIVSSIAHHAG